jgi:tetratricopeptide (TPR) repeat protein
VEWTARHEVLLVVGMAMLFFVTTNVIRHRWQLVCLVWMIIVAGVVIAFQGLWQGLHNHWGRIGLATQPQIIRGNFLETADYLAFLHMVFPLAASVFLFSRRSLAEKTLSALAALIFLASMAATGDLRHWFSWLAAAAVLGAYLLRKRGWKFHRALIGVGLFAIVIGATWLAALTLEGIAPPAPPASATQSISPTTATTTPVVPFWRSAVTMAVRNPFIGIGPGMFQWRYPEVRSQQGSPTVAGNGAFTLLAEYGASGALIALAAAVMFCIAAIQILNTRARRYSASSNSNRYAFVVAGLAVMAAGLVDVTTNSGFDACSNQLIFVTIMATALTCGQHNRDEHPEKTHIPGKHTLFRLTGIHRVMLTGGSVLGMILFLWLLFNTGPGAVFAERARQDANRNDTITAEAMYRRAFRADPRNFHALIGLADILAGRSEASHHQEAISLYERALVLNPYAHGLHLGIAALYDAADNREKAAEHYLLAIQGDPRNAAYRLARAHHHLRWNENDLAQAEFHRASVLDPALSATTTNAPDDDPHPVF